MTELSTNMEHSRTQEYLTKIHSSFHLCYNQLLKEVGMRYSSNSRGLQIAFYLQRNLKLPSFKCHTQIVVLMSYIFKTQLVNLCY